MDSEKKKNLFIAGVVVLGVVKFPVTVFHHVIKTVTFIYNEKILELPSFGLGKFERWEVLFFKNIFDNFITIH